MALRSRDIEIEDLAAATDETLAGRASRGDAEAFEQLYRRHADAAWRVAQAVAGTPEDAADAASEGFTRVLQALAAGRLSPDVPFRPYLLTTVRNVAVDEHRRRLRLQPHDGEPGADEASGTPDPGEAVMGAASGGLLSEAFHSLPERWRSVLWLTEVEGMATREVGDRLGLSANGVAQLSRRARAGLRGRYLQAHLRHRPAPDCETTVGHLGAYAAGTLPAGLTSRVEQHLEACPECRSRAAELDDLGRSLLGIALPMPIALGALTWIRYQTAFGSGVVGSVKPAAVTGLDRLHRALAVTTAALLVLGVITAALLGNGQGIEIPPARAGGGAEASAPPVKVELATTGPAASAGDGGSGPQAAIARLINPQNPATTGPVPTTVSIAPVSTPRPQPGRPAPTGPTPTTAPPPLAGATVSVNTGGVSYSASAGVGGGCSGTVSVNGSGGCEPPPAAPAAPGLSATLTTPLTTLSVG